VLYALFTCPKGDHTSSRLYCESCDVLPIVFHFLYQYIADSSVSDDAGENYACNTLAFKMTRFLCVPHAGKARRGWRGRGLLAGGPGLTLRTAEA